MPKGKLRTAGMSHAPTYSDNKQKDRLLAGQLSNIDIQRELGRDNSLKIVPFDSHCLKAASYDLTPSMIAMSSKLGMLETVYRENRYCEDRYYIIVHPGDTVLVVSNEYFCIPNNMAGYLSSRVSSVVEGFGHISTTIDPLWRGALLIAVSNPSKQRHKLYVGQAAPKHSTCKLATVCLHYLATPYQPSDASANDISHLGMRQDLLNDYCYRERGGIRNKIRRLIHWKRRAFTDYFFSRVDQYGRSLTPQEWEKFQKEFSPTCDSFSSEQISANVNHSRKSRKTARDFIIAETPLVRLKDWIMRRWRALVVMAIVLFFMLQFFLPEKLSTPIKEFLETIVNLP